MSINSNYTTLATAVKHLKNPNAQTGTLLIEIPADIGRAKSAYERGGIIEATEKFSKEIMSAAVWLFGIPAFNWIGNKLTETFSKLPMDIDYSNKTDGDDAIRNTVEYLKTGNTKGLDVSELEKYANKFEIKDVDRAISTIKKSKQVIAIGAWILNCTLMGVVLPKLNQHLTKKRLEKNKAKNATMLKPESMQDYQNRTKKDNLSFTGLADTMTYNLTANNTFRLISTDVPMIIGRCATARNKYEALEILMMDSAAIYFYNFSLKHAQDILRKIIPTPEIGTTVAECISKVNKSTLQKIIEGIDETAETTPVKELFGKEIGEEIYRQATDGRYGKINRFVKYDELKDIDNAVKNLLQHIKDKNIIKNGELDSAELKKLIKNLNIKNGIFYGVGIVVSFLGLGILIPKLAYAITNKMTGKDGFIALEEDNNKKQC